MFCSDLLQHPPSPAPCTALLSPLLHILYILLYIPPLPGRSGLESARVAHPSQGLVSFICFYCPLLGSGKDFPGRNGALGSVLCLFLSSSALSSPLLSFLCAILGGLRAPFGVPPSLKLAHISWRGSSFPQLTDTASPEPLGDRTCVTVARH